MSLPLEDLFNDVIAKSMRGLSISDADLAAKSGVSEEDIADAKAGKVNDKVLRKIAPHLQLDGLALVTMAHTEWRPLSVSLPCLEQFNSSYHDMTVNSYLVWDADTKNAVAFDTGADATPMIEFIQSKGLNLSLIFLTHTHGDHIADLAKLSADGAVTVFVHDKEPCAGAKTFTLGETDSWESGGLRIEPRSTWGHSKGGITYVVSGLKRPLAIVGDALFASSMGGGMVSYADALATNRKEIFTLPDNTVICPGHGPMTTVGEEKEHNPFYPEFK
ncbi:MBL fold metallo-hydrolase [Prosthecobacter sp.]|uniref:MBL fold metallo-hydrolase n=1 Tax=Prosthecobacter sp. TaxID=1965333 RepID=UPI003782FB99